MSLQQEIEQDVLETDGEKICKIILSLYRDIIPMGVCRERGAPTQVLVDMRSRENSKAIL